MAEETMQAVWNFDGAELQLLFQLKLDASIKLRAWDLESTYWSIRDLRREIDAKLNRTKKEKIIVIDKEGKPQEKDLTEKEMVDTLLEEVEAERRKFMLSKQEDDDSSRFYVVLEGFYMHIAHLMKTHGLYFREGDDPSQAFRRR